jgi:hypothetical protein
MSYNNYSDQQLKDLFRYYGSLIDYYVRLENDELVREYEKISDEIWEEMKRRGMC